MSVITINRNFNQFKRLCIAGTKVYNKLEWGFEAKNGLRYRICSHKIRCPLCLRNIWAEEIRHKQDKNGDWMNGCVYCRNEWEVVSNAE
jgi:hypothetical protein